MLYFSHRFPKGEKHSPSPSVAHLSGASLEYAERSDSSVVVLLSPCSHYIAQSLANRLDGLSGGVPVPVFPSAPPMQVLAIVRSTATVGETETAHMKQCFQNIYRPVALTHCTVPVPKTKSHLRLHSGCDLA